jgi:hypothetical protein
MPTIATSPSCEVIELRQYTLRPGQRDILIELFDREFIETQEAVGMRVLGQFRSLDDPACFIWLRGFTDMPSRLDGLAAFYGGPVWQAHRDVANATMLDSDNVLLLRPAWAGAGITASPGERAGPDATGIPAGAVDVSIFPLHGPANDELVALLRERIAPLLADAGALRQGWYVTESAPNTFPALPVREGEHVIVGVALFDNLQALDAFANSAAWTREALPLISPWLARPMQGHRLVPTARSAIHAGVVCPR